MQDNLIKLAYRLGYEAGMQKVAADDAGIGSYRMNNPDNPHTGSYIGRLQRNAGTSSTAITMPELDVPFWHSKDDPVSGKVLQQARTDQAEANAEKLFPKGSDAYKKLLNAAIQRGRANHEEYRRTGNVTPKPAPNLGFQLPPEEWQRITDWFNSQAKAAPTSVAGVANV